MTSREWEVLHQLARSRGRSSLRDIAARLGVSLEYARLLCRSLYTRHLLDQEPAEVFTLTVEARNLVEGRAWARGERGGTSPPVGEGQIDRATVQAVADTLSDAVQRSIQRQLRRGAGSPPLLEREPVTIKTTFDDPTDATVELETNLREPVAEEARPGVTVRKQTEALEALRTRR